MAVNNMMICLHEDGMAVFGYIFLAVSKEHQISLGDQQRMLGQFAASLGLNVDEVVVEESTSMKKPPGDRPAASKLLSLLQPGDTVIVLKSEWLLASAKEGARLLRGLKKRAISLFCADLKENISMPTERKLVVSEGSAELIQTLLDALAICEESSHGDAIKATKRKRKRQGKYLGGPVPFGWQVNDSGDFEQKNEEQQIIEEINSLRADRWSYRDISAKLQQNRGIHLSHEGIRRILKNDRQRKEADRIKQT